MNVIMYGCGDLTLVKCRIMLLYMCMGFAIESFTG